MAENKIYNGIYTVNSPTGEHRTFKITTCKHGNLKDKRIISLLTGPDNYSDYLGIGFVNDTYIVLWKQYKDSKYANYANCLWEMIIRGDTSHYKSLGMELLLEKSCLRCNRRLTTPESIQRGIGPECYGKMGR